MIHQGTRLIPCDFIAFGQHHDILLANLFAQGRGAGVREDSRAGPVGGDSGLGAAPPRFRGQPPVEHDFGRASDPETLGKLIALYEHNVFTPGTIWGIDSFDPWASNWAGDWPSASSRNSRARKNRLSPHDSSTHLINHYRQLKEALWRLST